MPIGSLSQVANAILLITAPPTPEDFPKDAADAATKWGDVADVLLSAVIPVSATASAGRSAFVGVLSAVTPLPPTGIILLKAAFAAYAAALAGGMAAGGYTGVPPPAPPLIETVLIAPVPDAAVAANALAALLVAWAKTGTAILIAPPNTPLVWT